MAETSPASPAAMPPPPPQPTGKISTPNQVARAGDSDYVSSDEGPSPDHMAAASRTQRQHAPAPFVDSGTLTQLSTAECAALGAAGLEPDHDFLPESGYTDNKSDDGSV